jgi:hypothetical protein
MGVVFTMDRSFNPTELKPQESTGKSWQASLPLIGEVPTPEQQSAALVRRFTFRQALRNAAHHSGMEDGDIANKIHISSGYMSKFMASVGEQWAKRLIKFMRVTQSLAPLQWIADQMGCDITLRSALSAELAKAHALIAEHERERRVGRMA